MTKKTCPLGEDCDLTVAWMAGRESAKDEYKGRIAAALEEASAFLDENALQKGYTKTPQGRTAIYYARKIRALIPDAGAALDRALAKAREEGRREEREACAQLAHDLQVSADQINDAYAAKRLPGVFLEPDGYEIAAAIRARAAELEENQ